jgi:hypothetical protein
MDAAVVLPAAEEPTPVELGARARQWRVWLSAGVYGTRAELARAEGVSRAAVTQALRRLCRCRQFSGPGS